MAAVWLCHFAALAFCGLFHGEDSRHTRNALDCGFSDSDLYVLLDASRCVVAVISAGQFFAGRPALPCPSLARSRHPMRAGGYPLLEGSADIVRMR